MIFGQKNVHTSMLLVIHSFVAESQYHQVCSINFSNGKLIPVKYNTEFSSGELATAVGRPADAESSDALKKTCEQYQ